MAGLTPQVEPAAQNARRSWWRVEDLLLMAAPWVPWPFASVISQLQHDGTQGCTRGGINPAGLALILCVGLAAALGILFSYGLKNRSPNAAHAFAWMTPVGCVALVYSLVMMNLCETVGPQSLTAGGAGIVAISGVALILRGTARIRVLMFPAALLGVLGVSHYAEFLWQQIAQESGVLFPKLFIGGLMIGFGVVPYAYFVIGPTTLLEKRTNWGEWVFRYLSFVALFVAEQLVGEQL